MINAENDIDNFLLIEYLSKNPNLDKDITIPLTKWFASLKGYDSEKIRKNAKDFLENLAQKSLAELHLPELDQNKLVKIFEPLEKVFKVASSLNEKDRIRDHLSHTVRNFLLANYILEKYEPQHRDKEFRLLSVATIFHDIAYPIQQFKKVAKKLTDSTIKEYLNSTGNLDFEIEEPENLLDILDIWGNLMKINNGNLDKKILYKVEYTYKNIINPTIAGSGIFDAPHCKSSVVLFLRPIINQWKNNETYWQSKVDEICDICINMAFHDRKMFPNFNGSFNLSKFGKALRIADELQEWERDEINLSFVKNAKIITGNTDWFLEIFYELKDSIDSKGKIIKCDPIYQIKDKILGLYPICTGENIKLSFSLPNRIEQTVKVKNIVNNKEVEEEKAFAEYIMEEFSNANLNLFNIANIDKKFDLIPEISFLGSNGNQFDRIFKNQKAQIIIN